MNKLRVLNINVAKPHPKASEHKCNFHVTDTGDLKYLSNNLRSLHWDGYPFKSLPLKFDPQMLVELNMKCSRLKTVWEGNKSFPKLKFIDLSHSKHLIKTPDFSGAPVSRLILEGCISLAKVHSSIGTLNKLSLLNLKGCSKLKKLPESICELTSLENLNISSCSKLKKLPNDIGSLRGLVFLEANDSGVQELPASFALLTKLDRLSLEGWKGGGSKSRSTLALFRGLPPREGLRLGFLSGLCFLERLNLSDCNLMEGALPNDLGSLPLLRDLYLSGNNFTTLPASLSQLRCLFELKVDGCKSLRSLTELPSSIQHLNANNCTSLETFSYPSSITPAYSIPRGVNFRSQFYGCLRLMENEESDILEIILSRIRVAPSITSVGNHMAMVPGSEIPEWFIHQSQGNSATLKLPPDCLNNTRKMGLAFCAVVGGGGGEADHIVLEFEPVFRLQPRVNYLQLSVDLLDGPKDQVVKKCGFRLVYMPCWEEEEEEITRIQDLEAIQYDTVPSISCPPSSLPEFPNEVWSSEVLIREHLIHRFIFGIKAKYIQYGRDLNTKI